MLCIEALSFGDYPKGGGDRGENVDRSVGLDDCGAHKVRACEMAGCFDVFGQSLGISQSRKN